MNSPHELHLSATSSTGPASTTTNQPLLSIRDLTVSFPSRTGLIRAADGVSFTVYPRQTLAVVGESGSGKSISALSILRLLPPAARIERGSIHFRPDDRGQPLDLLQLAEPEMRSIRGGQIAMIFQEPMTSLNPVFTIGDQITEAIRLHRDATSHEARAIALDAMTEVGITDPARRLRQFPHEFSGGMRQRAMIAMALACRPRLLLADEPTTALDVTIQAQILDLLAGLKNTRGLAVVLITHDLGIVAQHADVVCVMYSGRVVEYARVEELFAQPLHPYTRGLLACIPKIAAGSRPDRLTTVREVVEDPRQFETWPAGIPGAGLRAWWPTHTPPTGASTAEHVLTEMAPGHWVAVWSDTRRSDDQNAEPVRGSAHPDLAYARRA